MDTRDLVSHQWADETRLQSVAQRIEPDRRFKLRALGDRLREHASNPIEEALVVEAVPIVSSCSNRKQVFDRALTRFPGDDVRTRIHELTNVDR